MQSILSEPGDGQWVYLRRLTENSKGNSLIMFPLGPFKTPVTFLVDTGAQMSALQRDVADNNGIVANKKPIQVTDVFSNSKSQPTAQMLTAR